MKCCIVKELLPNYIDGLTGEEANEEIRNHLETCETCRKICEQMAAEIPEQMAEDDDGNKIDFLKKMRRELRKRYVAVILLTCAVVTGLILFANHYAVPIPYNPECMKAEIYQAAPVVDQFGITYWEDLNILDFEMSKAVLEGKYDTINLVHMVITEPAVWDGMQSCSRTVNREGEEVRVVYYCYTRTLWNRMFPQFQTKPNHMISTGDIYGQRLYRAEYQPVMTELYYLPIREQQLERLSDEEFEAQKDHAVLVWSGMN